MSANVAINLENLLNSVSSVRELGMCGEDLVWDSTSSMLLISEWASPATDHETFLMIVDGAWRLDSSMGGL